jgi:protein ImuB
MFAALHLPDFSVVAAMRGRSDLQGRPCAILNAAATDDAKGKLPLAALNRIARLAGIGADWPLNRALVRCPDLRVLPRDPSAEAALLLELIELAESLTPDFEITAADLLTLDLPGKLPSSALVALPEAELWYGLADTPDLAGLTARHELTQGRHLAPGDLAPAPIHLLRTLATDSGRLDVLDMWGLKTLGEFMALPRQALIERLGPQAGRWHDVLHGKTRRLLRLHRPPESMVRKIDFEEAIVSLDPLVFALKRLLHTLSSRLAARHLAASCLDLRLILETGAEVPRRIHLPEPQSTVEGMLGPLQTWLDSLQLTAAITALELDAEITFATAAQREWFGRQLPQPERWAETLARLEALLGPGRVGIPVPPVSHAPDAFTLRPAAGAVTAIAGNVMRPPSSMPLHRYRPPREIAVAHESRGGHPLPLALLTGPCPGPIIDVRGPYPASGNWWEAAGSWQRLEWDVQVASRHLLRLVFQTPDRWLLDGIYQ